MKLIATIFALIQISFNAIAGECPSTPDNLKKSIESHIRKIRASEYCSARSIKTDGVNTIAVYTAEGACEGFSNKLKAGSCSNQWDRFMIGSINGKIIGPIAVGGKGDLSDEEIKITGNFVELTGLSIGPDDPMCCPSVPKTKKFQFSQNGFNKIKQ